MNKCAGKVVQPRSDLVQAFTTAALLHLRFGKIEVPSQTVLQEVVLLPTIQIRVEFHLELRRSRGTLVREMPSSMQDYGFIQRALIQWPADSPWLIPVAPKILLSEIFHPDQTLCFVVKIDLRNSCPNLAKKARDRDVMPVLLALISVLHQDQ
jgi:hypothetical protein